MSLSETGAAAVELRRQFLFKAIVITKKSPKDNNIQNTAISSSQRLIKIRSQTHFMFDLQAATLSATEQQCDDQHQHLPHSGGRKEMGEGGD